MRYVTAIAFLFVCVAGLAQDEVNLDHLMKKKFLHCHDISLNCQQMIPRYLELGQLDSVAIVLQYWNNRCPSNQARMATEVLFRIQMREFDEQTYRDDFLPSLLAYKAMTETEYYPLHTYYGDDYARYSQSLREYLEFLRSYAREVKTVTEPSSLESLLCDFYDHNFSPLLDALKTNALAGTSVQEAFAAEYHRLMDMPEFHWAGIGEFWIPTGQAATLGNQGGAGLAMGVRHRRFMFDILFLGRFGRAKNEYSVFDKDSLYTTDYFSGAHMAIDAGQVFFNRNRAELAVVGGLGYENITAIPADEKKGREAVMVGTFNLNGGISYRYYYGANRAYVGVQARYNVVDYFTKGGTDLSGNTISLRLMWGISQNVQRRYGLARLGY